MNPFTGTFISMDSYQGSIYDSVSLHKYLYANANPVMYTDPSGYATDKNLAETAVAATIAVMLASSVALHNQAMLNIYSSLRKNMADAALSLQCTVTVTDWKNMILGFPAHEFDTKWLITIPMALSSWQLFEVIYATDEDTSNLPGVPAEEQEEKDKVNGVLAEEKDEPKIIQNNSEISKENKEKWGKGTFDSVEKSLEHHYKKHEAEVGARDINHYVQKADGFRQNLKGAKKSYLKRGTPEAIRYTKKGKYIIIGPDGKILSYGLERKNVEKY